MPSWDEKTVDAHGPPPPPEPQAPEKIGPYVLLDRIGVGGMGAVYSAYHPQLDRRVAVKLLLSAKGGEDAIRQERLLREAQAMAKLSHPNVVAVHDAGIHDGRVFLVMEIVEGVTLRTWLAELERPWRQVLRVFLEAGTGLAAAHAAGLVHRDFKPSNVLVGRDGHVRVTDFGLAKPVGGTESVVEGRVPVQLESSQPMSLNSSAPLTRSGAVLGTPAYMSPEQLRGLPADPRSDQFSFCVALYESLLDERPYGSQFDPFRDVPPPTLPPGSPIPRRIQRALLRGLSADPAARFPAMDALLAELSRDTARAARRALLVLGAAVAVLAIGLLALRRPAAACADLGHEWSGLWDDGARGALRTHLGSAPASAVDGTIRLLDDFAAPWSAERRSACEQLVSSRPGDALLTLACLDRQKEEMAGLLQVLSQGDAEVVRHAPVVAGQLLPPARCRDPRALSQMPKLPTDAATRLEVGKLRVMLAAAAATYEAGKEKEAARLLEPIAARAEKLGYRPLHAEALYWLGLAQETWSSAAAVKTLTRSEETAEAAGVDATAALAAAHLAWTTMRTAPQDARGWAHRAQILLQRTAGDPLVEAAVENAVAGVAEADAQDEDALAHTRRAYQLREQVLGPNHLLTLRYLGNVGIQLVNLKRNAEAITPLRRAADGLMALGAEASAAYDLKPLASAEAFLGQFTDAEAASERAAAIIRRDFGTDDQLYAESLIDQSEIRIEEGRAEDALAAAKTAEGVMTRTEGASAGGVGDALVQEGAALVLLGKSAEAADALERALAIYDKDQRPDLAEALIPLAEARNDMRQWPAALDTSERAMKLLVDHRTNPGQLAWARFQKARALAGLDRDRPEAAALAAQAREELAAIAWKRTQLGLLEKWMKQIRLLQTR